MPYTVVSWTAGDVITSTKLAAMSANEAYFYKRYDNCVFLEEEAHTDTQAAYTTLYTGSMYIPDGSRDELTVYCQTYVTNAETASFRLQINSTGYSNVMTETVGSYTANDTTVSSFTNINNPGWNLVEVQGKADGVETYGIRALVVIVSPE